MYESFFNFRERPFNLTPDPKYLFLSGRHREALAHLLYGIRQRSGFILLTGEVGTGKTTLCRALLHALDADTEVALIFNPSLSAEELLQAINREFGLPGQSQSRKALVDELNGHLLARRRTGKNLVLLVDEAQNLSAPVLEELRLLSNLETETEKLLQIVLIGQPELNDLLQRPELRQLDQRMSVRYHLEPLDQGETGEYVSHRLGVASDRSRARFNRRALGALFRYSRGAPRLINIAADRALLVGFTRNRHLIGRGEIRAAVRELSGSLNKDRPGRWLRRGVFAAATLALVAAGARVPWRDVADRALEGPLAPLVARVSTPVAPTPGPPPSED
ncbi:MAG: ExeA family protein, partial [Myxococcota bacterium]